MTEWHLDREVLERFLGEQLPDGECQSIQRHLLTCTACEQRLLGLLQNTVSHAAPPGQHQSYHRIIRRLLEGNGAELSRRRRRLAAERFAAAALWRELEPCDPVGRRTRLLADHRLQSWGFFELLLERARQAVIEDARAAEELLLLALDVVEQLSPEEYGAGTLEAARTRAWTYLGNARRVLGDFRQADAAFQTAELYLSRSWLDPLDEALLLELKAILRRGQRRFDEAVALLDGAIAIYREVNDPHLEGRALVTKGLAFQYQGNFAEAMGSFSASLRLLDGGRDPRLVGMSRYNLIVCLADAGRNAEAVALIPEARRLMAEVGTRSDRLRLLWLEGRVATALGRLAEAEETLSEARAGFVEDGLGFDVALVSLDLATVYLRQSRFDETKRLASELLSVFRSREVHREAFAALLLLKQAADVEQLTLGLLDEVASHLKQAREDPGLNSR